MRFSELELDALVEALTIGMGHASSALSVLTGKRVHIHLPEAAVKRLEDVSSFVGRPEQLVAAVRLKLMRGMRGQELGDLFLIIPWKSALELIATLQGKERGEDEFSLDEMGVSALKELGNILSGSAVAAIGKFLGLEIFESVPSFAYDMLQSVLSPMLASLAAEVEDIFVYKTIFEVEGREMELYLLIFFSGEALSELREKTRGVLRQMLHEYIEAEFDEV